jgi:hypothetical protein
MKTIILSLFILFIFACQPKPDEQVSKKLDTINLKLNTIYKILDDRQIGKIDSLEKINDYRVLIWRTKK